MRTTCPDIFETWVGGFLGPSYHIVLSEGSLTYSVYEHAYEHYSTEVITPGTSAWSRFLSSLDSVNVWQWQKVYKAEASCDATTWYLAVSANGLSTVSRGINVFAPGFVDYLRAVRGLIDGRAFA